MIQAIDRKHAPIPKDIGAIKIKEAIKTSLDNGIPVYSVNAGFQDLVRIELLFMNASYDPLMPIISSAANRMLSEGSTKHTAQQLAEMIDSYGAFYETDESSDSFSVILFTLNKYLDQTLPVLREILTDAVFPENELSVFKQNNIQRLAVQNEKVSVVSRKKFNEIIFGAKHPYGHSTTSDDYEQLDRKSLQDFHKRNYNSNGCTVIASGKVDDSSIGLLNKYFGKNDWSSNKVVRESVPAIQPDPEKKHRVEKKGAVQSAIRIGKVLFNKAHPDYIPMTVLNTALGGYFGSRLMSNIREDKGYTYGIGSAVVSMKNSGCFFISTEVGVKVKELAVEEIYKEVEKLRKAPLEDYELLMVKNFMIGSFLKSIDGAFQLADRWKSLYIYGLDYEYYYRFLGTVRNIKPEELMALAEKYLNPVDFYEVVAG